MTRNGGNAMQFFVELLVWHLIIAAFLIGALFLSRTARASHSPMTFADNTRGR